MLGAGESRFWIKQRKREPRVYYARDAVIPIISEACAELSVQVIFGMRYIVAIRLEEQIIEHVLEAQESLRTEFPSVAWLEKEQLFLTLKFLGNPRRRANQLGKMLKGVGAQVAPFQINLSKMGSFPESGPVKTVWINVAPSSDMLNRFQQECERAFLKVISDQQEEREFIPHVVLGRVQSDKTKGKLRRAVEELSVESLSQEVNQIELIQSILTKAGPKYETVARAPLTAVVV